MLRLPRPLVALFIGLMALASCTQTPAKESPVATRPSGPQVRLVDTYSVATYNVQNLFDTHDNPYTKDQETKPKTKASLEALASAIKELNADILVLEEVEAGGFLKQFNSEYLADMKYLYAVDTVSDDPRGITVAMLSRYPVVRAVSHRFMELVEGIGPRPSNRFARDLARFDVRIQPGYEVSVFGVHLKSKFDTEGDPQSNAWRLREANRIAAVFADLQKNERITTFMIVGDFNDGPDSPSTLRILNSTKPPMIDTLAGVDPRITFKNTKYKESIDNIFISSAMKSQLVGKATIMDGGVFDTASDHRPVRVTLKLP